MNLPPVEMSFTSATSHLPCGYRFQHEQRIGRGAYGSEAAYAGTLLHLLLLWLNRGLIERRAKPGQAGRSSDPGMARNLLAKIFKQEGLSPQSDLGRYITALSEVFIKEYKLPTGDGEWLLEERMAVGRDWQPVEIGEAKAAGVDLLAGTGDVILVHSGGLTGELADGKFGHRHFAFDSAKDNLQLLTYTLLLFMGYPSLRTIEGSIFAITLHGVTNPSHTFHRDAVIEQMQAFYDEKWATVDGFRAEYGEGDWPTKGDACCCTYCGLVCPDLERIKGETYGTP